MRTGQIAILKNVLVEERKIFMNLNAPLNTWAISCILVRTDIIRREFLFIFFLLTKSLRFRAGLRGNSNLSSRLTQYPQLQVNEHSLWRKPNFMNEEIVSCDFLKFSSVFKIVSYYYEYFFPMKIIMGGCSNGYLVNIKWTEKKRENEKLET